MVFTYSKRFNKFCTIYSSVIGAIHISTFSDFSSRPYAFGDSFSFKRFFTSHTHSNSSLSDTLLLIPLLYQDARNRAIGMLQYGRSQAGVARYFGPHHNTDITETPQPAKYNVSDYPRTGRPRVTTQRQDNDIRSTHLRIRFQTASLTARTIPGHRSISFKNCPKPSA